MTERICFRSCHASAPCMKTRRTLHVCKVVELVYTAASRPSYFLSIRPKIIECSGW